MKLHLPVLLRKALLACFAFAFACSGSVSAADLSLGSEDSPTIDYADAATIPDLDGGALTLKGNTILLLSNCGEGDGKTYTLLTGVSGLLDADGNPLPEENKAASLYFDTTQPGTGFWANGWLQLADDGSVQLVLHDSEVLEALTITTRQTASQQYNYYKSISFQDITYTTSSSSSGGAIDGYRSTITLSNNGSVTFSENTASALGGAIYGSNSSTITLSNNGSVTFSENTASSGGAICGYLSTITLSNNGSVTFSENTASSLGGAIDGGSSSTITLSNNGSVTFSENTASLGGAIYGDGDITLSNNGSVTFSENTASSGGAIEGDGDITLSNNGSVTFSENTASSLGGAIDGYRSTITLSNNGSVTFSENTASYGGAIDEDSSTITLSNNGSVTFSGNTASYGGAIRGYHSTITLSNNGSVTFCGNTASSGGAIYHQPGFFSIQNNKSVLFEGNYTLENDTLRLQSICAFDTSFAGNELVVNFSAPKTGRIEFRDGVYIDVALNSASEFNLNAQYTNEYNQSVAQTGDIIFTGAYITEKVIKDILEKHQIQASEEDIAGFMEKSKTSEVWGVMELHDGRLIIRDGAIMSADGIKVHSSASLESTPTLLLHHGTLTSYLNTEHETNVITISSGSALELAGQNEARYSAITMAAGSTLIVNVDNTHTTGAAMTLNSSSLTISGALTLELNAAADLTDGQSFALLTGVSQPTNWSSTNVTVTSGTAGWDVSFDNLTWDGDTLWLYYDTRPDLVTATWTNETADGKWNTTSLNWEQDELDYEYKDGVAVVFGDEGADTVTLVGNIAPGSVLVDSTQDYTWEVDGTKGGKLTGNMKLTKQGAGTLNINTSNDYTGGTLIEGGKLVAGTATALGTGDVVLNGGTLEIADGNFANELETKGESSLVVQDGKIWYMSATFTNSGTLNISGTLDVTQVGALTDHGVTYTKGGSNGFKTSSAYSIKLVENSGTINSTATIKHGDIDNFVLGSDGVATAAGTTDYKTYYITAGHEAAVDTIRGESGNQLTLIDMTGGTLNVNESTDKLVATGGSIQLSAGTLGGTIGGTAAVAVSGTATISGNNSYTGGTTLSNGNLTITHANALGTGDIVSTGDSKLVVNGVTLVLGDSIANTGELTLSGSIDASGLTLNRTEEGRLALDGTKVSLAESGFARGVEYSVQIVQGGTTVNNGASISHKDYLSRTQLVLGEDGYARAGGAEDYTLFFLTGGDSAVVSEIAAVATQHQETLTGVTMDSGTLEVDQSMAVNATGGSIIITKAATLSGSIEDAAVSTAAGDCTSEISALLKGDTTLEVNGGNITVSGDNSYTGGTVVNGGALLAGHNKAFGAGDVTVNGATLDLNCFTVANKVTLNGNSTLGHANGASHIVLGGGSNVNFRDGFELSAGKVLEVAAGGATYTGALTLGGGTLELDGLLTVQGDVVFSAGTQTTIDISGWAGADDGEVLATLGSSNSGYTDESLKLTGIAGEWELDFDASTGVLTLVAVKDEPLPEPEFNPDLNRNQQIVYDTLKDIMGEGNPGGLLGELGKEVTGTRDEEKLKQLLDELGGAEYATLLSGQQAAARAHMGRLRGTMGSGYMLAGEKTRAYIEAYNHRSEVDGDDNGRGYELNESGGQFALEFLGKESLSGGFAVAAGHSKLQPDGGMTQKSDNTYVDAFLIHRDGAYTAKFSLGVGVHKYDLDRRVAGNAVEADASGSSVNFMHESAWGMALAESHSVQFFGAVESTFNKLGAFFEKGADTASLQVEGQDAWVTTLSAGARYQYSFAALDSAPAATLSLQAGLEFDFGDTDGEVEMSFKGARRHSFRQSGAERDTFGYNLGASLHLPVSAKAAIYASGDAVLRGDSYEVNANVGLQMAF